MPSCSGSKMGRGNRRHWQDLQARAGKQEAKRARAVKVRSLWHTLSWFQATQPWIFSFFCYPETVPCFTEPWNTSRNSFREENSCRNWVPCECVRKREQSPSLLLADIGCGQDSGIHGLWYLFSSLAKTSVAWAANTYSLKSVPGHILWFKPSSVTH